MNDTGEVHRDVCYAVAGAAELKLDLFLPPAASRTEEGPGPLIVWIHGGGWHGGDKADDSGEMLLQRGYAWASVNYRLSPEASYPAQIHDCKAAVRFLRAHAGRYGLDAERIAVSGASAGGHLASLLGVSAGMPELEGDLGWEGTPSQVSCVVDYFGPADLRIRFHDAVEELLGDHPDNVPELARLASPALLAGGDAAPHLIFHGEVDSVVPLDQSLSLDRALRAARASCQLVVVPGAGHGFGELPPEAPLRWPAIQEAAAKFFDVHLRPPGDGR